MTWPIVELAFWNVGDPGLPSIDALLRDPGTPLARHGLTGIATRYAAETGAELHSDQQWWVDELVMKSLGVDGALSEVAPAFDAEGIPWFTAKGPAIAYVDYPDPSMRPYTDLDVYVPGHAQPEAISILERLGYGKVRQTVGPLGGLPCEYHGGRFGAVVELHSHVIDNIHRRWLPSLAEWMDDVVRGELCGVDVNVLIPDAHAALQVIHLAAGHRFQKLMLLRDIAEYDVPALPLGHELVERWRRAGRSLAAELTTAGGPTTAGGSTPAALRSLVATNPAMWNEHALSHSNLRALTVGLSVGRSARVISRGAAHRLRRNQWESRTSQSRNVQPVRL